MATFLVRKLFVSFFPKVFVLNFFPQFLCFLTKEAMFYEIKFVILVSKYAEYTRVRGGMSVSARVSVFQLFKPR